MRSAVVGTVVIAIGVLLGVALDVGLYSRDAALRAAQAGLQPVETPAVAQAPSTPIAATATPSAVVLGAAAPNVAAGEKVFAAQCGACHPNANAGLGPALHGQAFDSRYPDDGALKLVIRQGADAMPAFPESVLSGSDLDAMVTYIRSLK